MNTISEGKLLLNKIGVDLDLQIIQKQQQQKNFPNSSIEIPNLSLNVGAYSKKVSNKFAKSRLAQSKKNGHNGNSLNKKSHVNMFGRKLQMKKMESEKKYSKTCESSEYSFSTNSNINPEPRQPHIIKKGIKKYDAQGRRNEINDNDSWNFSSEDQFQQIPSITQMVEQEDKSKQQYYMHNLVGYISGYLTDLFMAQMYLSHFVQIYDNLRKSKLFKPQHDIKPLLQIQSKEPRKTLIVDLDETLVHCNESPLLKSDFFIPIHMNDKKYEVGISIRPYAQEFLRNMSEHFEIMIYTASNSDYANKIIDYLDPSGTVKYRLFREHCIQISPGCHLKDLRILNRDLKDIVLIDNSAYSFAYQLNNGIPIIPYLDNKNDDELLHLQYYLKELLKFDDVREVNKRTFHLEMIQNSSSIQQAVQHLF